MVVDIVVVDDQDQDHLADLSSAVCSSSVCYWISLSFVASLLWWSVYSSLLLWLSNPYGADQNIPKCCWVFRRLCWNDQTPLVEISIFLSVVTMIKPPSQLILSFSTTLLWLSKPACAADQYVPLCFFVWWSQPVSWLLISIFPNVLEFFNISVVMIKPPCCWSVYSQMFWSFSTSLLWWSNPPAADQYARQPPLIQLPMEKSADSQWPEQPTTLTSKSLVITIIIIVIIIIIMLIIGQGREGLGRGMRGWRELGRSRFPLSTFTFHLVTSFHFFHF